MTQDLHQTHNDCIFCKIITGEIPAHKVYEDDNTFAFLDIKPINPGHTLVIPKDHFENILTTPDETMCRLIITARKLAIDIRNAVDSDGMMVMMNGEQVSHTHIHLIPRISDDGIEDMPHKTYVQGEAEQVLEKIKTEISLS
ncbi:MAG: hypothetical protein RL094_173 [Candidatus Parcubacteria bacterium]|jgi:histidine triad (HIT) family protein